MSSRDATPADGAEDGAEDTWWHAVYQGPRDSVPDTPLAGSGPGSVDEWFDAVRGVIAEEPRGAGTEPEGAATAAAGEQGVTAGGGAGVHEADEDVVTGSGPRAAGSRAGDSLGADEDVVAEEGGSVGAVFGRADGLGETGPGAPGAPVPGDEAFGGGWGAPPPPLTPPTAGLGSVDAWFDSAREMIEAEHGEAPYAPSPERTGHEGPGAGPSQQPAGPTSAPGACGAAAPQAPGAAWSAACSVPVPDPQAAGAVPGSRTVPGPREGGDPPAGSRRPAAPVPFVGDRPPTYDAEPTALPPADPDHLAELVPDTVVEGAHYGGLTLRAAGVRGDSARYRGEPRRDALLVARFGEPPDGILVAVVAGAARSSQSPPSAAAEACRQLAAAVGRSRAELLSDLRNGARDGLRFGLQRLVARAALPLRPAPVVAPRPAQDGPEGPPDPRIPLDQDPGAGGALHCLLAPLDPQAGDRVCFGVGPGGLFLLRSEHWVDAYGARLLHHPDEPRPAAEPADPGFRFRLVPATPGDVLLLATAGFADPVREEPAVARFLAAHWSQPHPPGTVDFLRQLQVRAKGYADDRTAVTLWCD